MADDGFDVALNDLPANSEKLGTLLDEIRAKGRASSQYVGDVSQEEQVKDMFEQVAEDHGGLDVVGHFSSGSEQRLDVLARWWQTQA